MHRFDCRVFLILYAVLRSASCQLQFCQQLMLGPYRRTRENALTSTFPQPVIKQ